MKGIAEDLTDAEKKGAWKVALTVGHRGILWVFILFSLGLFSMVGFPGFAKEADLDTKIAAAVDPIKTEQGKQAQQLGVISTLLKETLAQNKATEIRLLAARRCLESRRGDTQGLEITNREIQVKQDEYRRDKGYEYTIPQCADLVANPPP